MQYIKKVNFYFLLSIFICIYINVWKFPFFYIRGDIIGETATNFFSIAFEKSWLENLISLDGGLYLPWLQRLISVILIKVLAQIDAFPYLAQWSSLIFMSFCIGFINFRYFRKIVDDDFSRFLFSLVLAVFISMDSIKFYNMTYAGSILVLLILWVEIENLRHWKKGLIYILYTLLLPTKPHYFIFLPIHILFAYRAKKKNQKKAFIFYTYCIGLHMMQFLIILFNMKVWDQKHVKDHTFIEYISYVFKYFMFGIFSMFQKHLSHYETSTYLIFGSLILLSLFVYLFIKKRLQALWVVTLSFYIGLASIAISLRGFPKYVSDNELYIYLNKYHFRHFLFSDLVLLFGLFVLLFHVFQKWHFRSIFLTIVYMCYTTHAYVNFPKNYAIADSNSQWPIFKSLLQYNDYYIPTFTVGSFALTKNSEQLLMKSLEGKGQTLYLEKLGKKKNENWSVRGVYFFKNTKNDHQQKIFAAVFNHKGEKIAITESLTPTHYKTQYFRFKNFIENPMAIAFYKKDLSPANILPCHFIVFGKKQN